MPVSLYGSIHHYDHFIWFPCRCLHVIILLLHHMYASCLFPNNDDASFSSLNFMQWSCIELRDVVYYQFPFILLPIISVHFRHKIAVWKLLWHLMSKGVSRCLMLTFKQQIENSGFDGAFCNKYWWIWLNNVEWFSELSANYLRGATPNICQLKPKFSQPWFSVWLCLCSDMMFLLLFSCLVECCCHWLSRWCWW